VTVEEAIRTAIELEARVRDVYVEAAERTGQDEGERLFRLMADEEQRHLDYLEAKLAQWAEERSVSPERLETAVPAADLVREEVERLKEDVGGKPGRVEMEFLRKALAVERETSEFYARVVAELPGEASRLFRRFMEIEEGHLALVQAQIDAAAGTGYWFDVREFNLEG
jgi:rubrerythrin